MWWHLTHSLANLLIAAYCSDMLLQVLVVCYILTLIDESLCIEKFAIIAYSSARKALMHSIILPPKNEIPRSEFHICKKNTKAQTYG